MMTRNQILKNRINNVCKTIVKAGVDFKDVKIGKRKYRKGCSYRVFGERPWYGTIVNSSEGNGMMECPRNWYDVVEKGYNIKCNSGVYIKGFNNGEDICNMNAEEFISAFYHFLTTTEDAVFIGDKLLKGFNFNKKDMTLYLTID